MVGLTLAKTRSIMASPERRRPNILWILAEDASPHISCYGETAIKTPNLDTLAAESVRFENAFVTCPVCSPSRSAMVTGVYQTTLGAHNHRSQRIDGKGGGNTTYYDTYRLPDTFPMISDLFRQAGYYTCNGSGPSANRAGKTDYNFVNAIAPYDGNDWRECPKEKSFFAQIQLTGGKDRKSKIKSQSFSLPPYYPDHPVLREDWSTYLASWLRQDREIGQIIKNLREKGALDNTVIFYLTDHGISHMRGKQFLYEEGIHVPLIVRYPNGFQAGTVRKDLVLHIDLAATSLALAGLPIPEHLQGRDLFTKNYKSRDFIVAARDRCDETIDIIRCLRTQRFKYIHNFMSYRPHTQFNQYKDGKEIVKTMRQLQADGKLNALQSRIFNSTRSAEELYDLQQDPNETINLANDIQYKKVLSELRTRLYDWMEETGDLGLIPEPILEDWGREFGNKCFILQETPHSQLVRRLIRVIEAGEKGDFKILRGLLDSDNSCERYWAATYLGHHRDTEARHSLKKRTTDKVAAVRVAALLALCRLEDPEEFLKPLIDEIDHPNHIVGMYAMNAIEQTGLLNNRVAEAAEKAIKSNYDFIRRYGNRLQSKFHQ
jgi:arylsulfatase A-like enzyme